MMACVLVREHAVWAHFQPGIDIAPHVGPVKAEAQSQESVIEAEVASCGACVIGTEQISSQGNGDNDFNDGAVWVDGVEDC